ncbi:MAG: winged helix-turn-helix domain-containing protein [Candidatus Aenigmatarchaeota archaeon]
MLTDLLRSKTKKNQENNDNAFKLLDSQLSLISMELEKLKSLSQKIENIEKKVNQIEAFLKEQGVEIKTKTISTRTKETIITLLKRYGSLNPVQLAKLLNLSRTRCNEYLKEMENEGILDSEWKGRKKFYKIRQSAQNLSTEENKTIDNKKL